MAANPNTKYELVHFSRYGVAKETIGVPTIKNAKMRAQEMVIALCNLPVTDPERVEADGVVWLKGLYHYQDGYYTRLGLSILAPVAFRIRPLEAD